MSSEQRVCQHEWTERGTPDDLWRECWLCGHIQGDADHAAAGWVEAMRQQQRVEKALLLAACWDREADRLGRSLSELMLRDAARQLRAALADPETETDRSEEQDRGH